MSLFIDSGVGLVLSSYMVRFSHSIEQQKKIYSCEANSLGVVWCSYSLASQTAFSSFILGREEKGSGVLTSKNLCYVLPRR